MKKRLVATLKRGGCLGLVKNILMKMQSDVNSNGNKKWGKTKYKNIYFPKRHFYSLFKLRIIFYCNFPTKIYGYKKLLSETELNAL